MHELIRLIRFVKSIACSLILPYHIYYQISDRVTFCGILKRYFIIEVSLFSRAKDVTKKLSEFRLGSDSTFLDRLKKNAFAKYLSTYIRWNIFLIYWKNYFEIKKSFLFPYASLSLFKLIPYTHNSCQMVTFLKKIASNNSHKQTIATQRPLSIF